MDYKWMLGKNECAIYREEQWFNVVNHFPHPLTLLMSSDKEYLIFIVWWNISGWISHGKFFSTLYGEYFCLNNNNCTFILVRFFGGLTLKLIWKKNFDDINYRKLSNTSRKIYKFCFKMIAFNIHNIYGTSIYQISMMISNNIKISYTLVIDQIFHGIRSIEPINIYQKHIMPFF